jgi:large subunit ribosomal protein L3
MTGILGKKIGMTQVFGENGQIIPVTVIESGPCYVLQIKTEKSDGYGAIQLGLGEKKESRVKKPLREKFKKVKVTPKAFIKEICVPDPKEYQIGQDIDVGLFKRGDFVDIEGTSIGRGFQGGIKRWHWSGGPKSHGSMSHRTPGSIGASAYPSRVYKGHHLPGHMGKQRVNVQNLEVIKVDKAHNLLAIKGSVPGHKNSYLIIKKAKKKK